MAINKWMSVGLVIAALGWALLLLGWFCAAFPLATAPALPGEPMLSYLASSAIFSGFAIAILAALTQGFGSLDRFFAAALERSTPRAETNVQRAEADLEPASRRVIERGVIDDNVYKVFGDGSVELETLLGNRRFASLDDAHTFIGIR